MQSNPKLYKNSLINFSSFESIPSRIMFLWCFPLVKISMTQCLQIKHLWLLNKKNCARFNTERLKLTKNMGNMIIFILIRNPLILIIIGVKIFLESIVQYCHKEFVVKFVDNPCEYHYLILYALLMFLVESIQILLNKKSLEYSIRLQTSVVSQIYFKVKLKTNQFDLCH